MFFINVINRIVAEIQKWFYGFEKNINASPVKDCDFCQIIKLRCRSQMFIYLSPVLLVGNQLLKRSRSTFVYLLRVTTFTEARRTFALSAVLPLLMADGILSNQNLLPQKQLSKASERNNS